MKGVLHRRWVPLLIAPGLLVLFALAAWWSGDLAEFRAGQETWLQNRGARLGIVIALLAGYLPWARRVLADEGRAISDPRERRFVRRVAASALLLVPVIALLVDRDPLLYLQVAYWNWSNLFNWGIGGFLSWQLGALGTELWLAARHFEQQARRVALDPLDLEALAPLASFAVTAVLLVGLLLSVFSINFGDPDFRAVVFLVGALASFALYVAWKPLRAAHLRIREAKRSEQKHLVAALRGDPSAVEKLAIRSLDLEAPSLQDLLAYQAFLSELREWPFDVQHRFRMAFYLSLPIGSWVGGAMVERALSSWLA